MYCSKRAKSECDQLPPCRSSLQKHVQRANYQTEIWRMSLNAVQELQNPVSYGWKIEGEVLEIDWMDYFFLKLY